MDDVDDEDAEAVLRELALRHFPADYKVGLNLGFYRTFAVPTIARALARTEKLEREPRLRAKATGRLVYALIEHGLASPAAREVVSRLRTLHEGIDAGNEHYVYVMSAFCVCPVRWIDAHGWRRTTPKERAAAHRFYARLATEMGIEDFPASFEETRRWMREFERREFRPTPEADRLVHATRSLLADRAPRVLSPVLDSCFSALLNEELRRAFRIAPPSAAVRWSLRAALFLRARARGLLTRSRGLLTRSE
ncbi:oxygenase MpaB family protein [Streptantibioticus parmotrematis]|uniref:oxygenase MpaB family protein n=1 Tax=Streptantibioticus parmotrematis TaxID=2873249 RepID=UPI0033F33BF6